MAETTRQDDGSGAPKRGGQKWVLYAGAVLAGVALLVAASPRAHAFRMMRAHAFGPRAHAFGPALARDPEAMKQHVETAVEWALRGVSASDEQQQQGRKIADRAIDELAPLAGRHRANTEALARELAKPDIDRAAIDRLRQQQVALADEASKILVTGFTDLALQLTPEQRTELLDLAQRFHGHAVAPAR